MEMDNFDWLKDKVENLAGVKEQIAVLCEKGEYITYDKGLWAFWKLLIHSYYVDIFTLITKKRMNNVVYIDLLAGPGFNYLADINLTVAGSPLIAKLQPRVTKDGKSKAFDEMILVDSDRRNCASLERVLNEKVICADCNSSEVMSAIENAMKPKKSIYLAFIDPEGVEEVHWNTMMNLFKMPGDLIINYPWSGVARLVGSYRHTSGSTKESTGLLIDKFFGDETWRNVPEDSVADWLYDFYLGRVRRYRSEIVEFPIMMIGGAQYRILIATRQTKSGSPWLKPVYRLRNHHLNRLTDEDLKRFVEIYKGDQTTLDEFCS